MLDLDAALRAANSPGSLGSCDGDDAEAVAAATAAASGRALEERQRRLAEAVQGMAVALDCLVGLAQQQQLLQGRLAGAQQQPIEAPGGACSGGGTAEVAGPLLLVLLRRLDALLDDDTLTRIRALLHATRMAAAAAGGAPAGGPGAAARVGGDSQDFDAQAVAASYDSAMGPDTSRSHQQQHPQAGAQALASRPPAAAQQGRSGRPTAGAQQSPYAADVRLSAAELIHLCAAPQAAQLPGAAAGCAASLQLPAHAAGTPDVQAQAAGGVAAGAMLGRIDGIMRGLESLMAEQDVAKRAAAIQVRFISCAGER